MQLKLTLDAYCLLIQKEKIMQLNHTIDGYCQISNITFILFE